MQKKKHYKYSIKITENQADIIIRALENYSRVGIGQFKNIFEDIFSIDVTYREDVTNLLDALNKAVMNDSVNKYRGICSPSTPENVKIAYEISKSLLCYRSWEKEPKGGPTVNFHEPLKISKEPLIEIKSETKTTTQI